MLFLCGLTSCKLELIWKRGASFLWGPRYPASMPTPSPKHLLPPGAPGEVATPGPGCEQPILAAFHRKPDLRDRTGRKQMGVEPGSREGWHRAGLRAGKHYNCHSPNLVPSPKAGSYRGQGFGDALLCPAAVRIQPSSQRQPPPLKLPLAF